MSTALLRVCVGPRGEETAPAAERLRSSGRVLRRALLVVSDGVSYGLAARPRGGVAAVDAPLSLAKASGLETGELGAGETWAPQRKVVARRWPAVAARCNTMRCDAMLCCGRRCAESSRATRTKQKPRGLCGRMKRSSDRGMIGQLVRWWKSGWLKEPFSVPRCDWAGCWQAGGRQPMAGASEI